MKQKPRLGGSCVKPLIGLLAFLTAAAGHAQSLPLTHSLVFNKLVIPTRYDAPIRSNLVRLDPDGSTTNLTDRDNVTVRDPEISFDATRVVFSMRVGADTSTWQVYEVGVDGSGLRKLSRNASHNDLDPSYLPDGRIVFTTDRLRWSDGYENVPTTQLAVMDARGRNVEVLKVNTAGHINPLVGSDGMIYMTQWDFHDRRTDMGQEHEDEFDVNRFLLWKVFADGSGLDHPTFGAHALGDFTPGFVEIRERPQAPDTFIGIFGSEDTQELTSFVPDRQIFVPGNFLSFIGAEIVLMKPQANQNRDRIIYLTGSGDEGDDGEDEGDDDEGDDEGDDDEGDDEDEDEEGYGGTWRSPLPLADGRIVASFSPGEMEERYGPQPFQLWIMNGDGSAPALLYEDPGFWCIQAVEVMARTPPRLQPGVRQPQYPYAIINALDVTLRENDGQAVPAPGQVTEVRVYREDVRTANTHDLQIDEGPRRRAFRAWDDPDTSLLGTAPVHGDESFAIVVPADTPLTWELLDSAGNVIVRERFGTELRAGEVRQCAGCHAPHNGRQGATTNFALDQPTNLSGQNVDRDGNGVVDLLEELCASQPELCETTTSATVPVAPSQLHATAITSQRLRLLWQDNADNETKYLIFRKVAGTSGFERIATVAANTQRYVDNGLAPGTTYLYRIRAKNAAGNSAWSNRLRVTSAE